MLGTDGLVSLALIILIAVLVVTSWVPFLLLKEIRVFMQQNDLLLRLARALEGQSRLQPQLPVRKKEQENTTIAPQAVQTNLVERLDNLHIMLGELNESISNLKIVMQDFPPNPLQITVSGGDEFSEVASDFRIALQAYSSELKNASNVIVQDHRQFLSNIEDHLNKLHSQIEDILRQPINKPGHMPPQTNLDILSGSQSNLATSSGLLKSAPPPKPIQPESIISVPREQDKKTGFASNEYLQKFRDVREWVRVNLQRIMSRSGGEWSQPKDLLLDYSNDNNLTAQVLSDKVLLIGIKGYARHLALGLPNRHMGQEFYEWFSMPKGVDEEIKQTLDPAIVEQDGDAYQIIHRGTLKQD